MLTTGCLPNVAGMTTVVSTTLASVKWRNASLLKGNVAEELARLVHRCRQASSSTSAPEPGGRPGRPAPRPGGAGEATHRR